MNKVRKSNIELLRIIAMFLILLSHAHSRCLINYRFETPIIATLFQLLFIGVPIFVLISGYFGIKPSFKGIFQLWALLVFYKILMYVFNNVEHDSWSFNIREIISLFRPFSGAVGHWWFFRVYFLLYLISPILNWCKQGGKKKQTICLLLLGFITFYFGWIWANPTLNDGKNVINLAFIYMLGGWLKDNVVIDNNNRKRIRMSFLLLYVLIALVLGISIYFASPRMYSIIIRTCHQLNSPIVILTSLCVFMIFITFEFQSKPINWIASSSVAIYAIHENKYFDKKLWYGLIENQYLDYNVGKFYLILMSECLLFFFICILIDKIRMFLMKPINPVVDKIDVYLDKKINLLYKKFF